MLVKHSTISDKVYLEHPESKDIKVPFKKISQTDTISENGNVKNPDLSLIQKINQDKEEKELKKKKIKKKSLKKINRSQNFLFIYLFILSWRTGYRY